MHMRNQITLGILAIGLVVAACKTEVINPFDNSGSINEEPAVVMHLEEGTFPYLHYQIFSPTCANSGCHDGTFEPNFSSIESSYNSLVFHDIIKNDNAETYTYRVQPGNADLSLIIERMSGQMDGVEDQMPILIDPGSDFGIRRQEYIAMIRDWINQGAMDMFGNAPVLGNQAPRLVGAFAYADGGNTPLSRENSASPIEVPQGTSSLDIWLALTDDSTAVSNFGNNQIKFSSTINSGFPAANFEALTVETSPVAEENYFGATGLYYHHITIDPSDYTAQNGDQVFFRVYVDDLSNGVLELPTDGSFNYFKEYLSFIIVP